MINSIRFRQSGGFAGLVRGCDVAPTELKAAELRALERYAREGTSVSAEARDQVVYELEVATDGAMVPLAFDELSVPKELRSLVQRLAKRAGPMAP